MHVFFGGSFDPVHNGHLRIATELSECFGNQVVHLLPCGLPPHKGQLSANHHLRVEMLRAACADNQLLQVDTREVDSAVCVAGADSGGSGGSAAVSYTVETLHQLKNEGKSPIVMALGTDAALQLDRWHRFEELSTLCHLVVMKRPDYPSEGLGSVMQACGFEVVNEVGVLEQRHAGLCYLLDVTQLDISSSDIRRKIAQNRSIRYLVPDVIVDIICDNGRYGS